MSNVPGIISLNHIKHNICGPEIVSKVEIGKVMRFAWPLRDLSFARLCLISINNRVLASNTQAEELSQVPCVTDNHVLGV